MRQVILFLGILLGVMPIGIAIGAIVYVLAGPAAPVVAIAMMVASAATAFLLGKFVEAHDKEAQLCQPTDPTSQRLQ